MKRKIMNIMAAILGVLCLFKIGIVLVERNNNNEFQPQITNEQTTNGLSISKTNMINIRSKTQVKANKQLTEEEAVTLLNSKLKNNFENYSVLTDRFEERDSKEYFVMQAIEHAKDHITILGYYYIDIQTGEVFDYDPVGDKLTIIK